MLNGCITTRIYCRENCPPGRRTKPENRLQFESEGDARVAGFRPCKVCKPDKFEGRWEPRPRLISDRRANAIQKSDPANQRG